MALNEGFKEKTGTDNNSRDSYGAPPRGWEPLACINYCNPNRARFNITVCIVHPGNITADEFRWNKMLETPGCDVRSSISPSPTSQKYFYFDIFFHEQLLFYLIQDS